MHLQPDDEDKISGLHNKRSFETAQHLLLCGTNFHFMKTHAVLKPNSERPTLARNPAPPAPTTMASKVWSITGYELLDVLNARGKYSAQLPCIKRLKADAALRRSITKEAKPSTTKNLKIQDAELAKCVLQRDINFSTCKRQGAFWWIKVRRGVDVRRAVGCGGAYQHEPSGRKGFRHQLRRPNLIWQTICIL